MYGSDFMEWEMFSNKLDKTIIQPIAFVVISLPTSKGSHASDFYAKTIAV